MSAVFFFIWAITLFAQFLLIVRLVYDYVQFERKYPSKKKESKSHINTNVLIKPIDDLFDQSEVGKMSIEEYNLRRRVLIGSVLDYKPKENNPTPVKIDLHPFSKYSEYE